MPQNLEGLQKGRARYGTEVQNAEKPKVGDLVKFAKHGGDVRKIHTVSGDYVEAGDVGMSISSLKPDGAGHWVNHEKIEGGTGLENAIEHGTIKDYNGKTVMTFFSPEHLVKWMAQNGFGDIGDLEAKGYKFVPVENAEDKKPDFLDNRAEGLKRGKASYSNDQGLGSDFKPGDMVKVVLSDGVKEARFVSHDRNGVVTVEERSYLGGSLFSKKEQYDISQIKHC